ncbi:hypothetical protein [Bdellovibrio sp. HCB274]|uniref:hypothetical protein n=1 Tax=Bdellovibrio sp. HCB274 TaxID=3394361 RepID=UPI0039B69F9D
MKTVIQIITILAGFFLILQATAAQASMAAYRVNWRTAGLEKLNTDVIYHDDVKPEVDVQEVQFSWVERVQKMKCKFKSQLALDDFKGQTQNKVKVAANLEWQF